MPPLPSAHAKPVLVQHESSSSADGSPSTSFIQLVGMPVPDVVTNHSTMGLGFASSAEAASLNALAFPTLAKGQSSSSVIVDTIDALSEDPFTLESFEGLVRSHAEQGKDFLIARVLTMEDTANPEVAAGRLYYSYYAAHHINKVLFRTQPEEGLLHRMKAKNPLNNMTVVGDVHYYLVRTSDPLSNPLARKPALALPEDDAALIEIQKSMHVVHTQVSAPPARRKPSTSEFLNQYDSGIALNEHDGAEVLAGSTTDVTDFEHQRALSATSEALSLSLASLSSATTGSSRSATKETAATSDCLLCTLDANHSEHATSAQPERDIRKETASPTVSEGKPQSLTFVAHYYGTDDDYLMRRGVRETFKKNAATAEEVFLFTLHTDYATLVSDPTNPNARALPLDEAIQQYQNELAGIMEPSPQEVVSPNPSQRSSQHRFRRQRESISTTFHRFRHAVDRMLSSPVVPSDEPVNDATLPSPISERNSVASFFRLHFRERPHQEIVGDGGASLEPTTQQQQPQQLPTITGNGNGNGEFVVEMALVEQPPANHTSQTMMRIPSPLDRMPAEAVSPVTSVVAEETTAMLEPREPWCVKKNWRKILAVIQLFFAFVLLVVMVLKR